MKREIKTKQGFGRKAPKTVVVITREATPSAMEQLNRKVQATQEQYSQFLKNFGRYL